jgi:hypothetical protein
MRFAVGRSALFAGVASVFVASCGGTARNGTVTWGAKAPESAPPTAENAVPTRAIGGGPRDPDRRFSSTASKIARATCDREMRCGNVGPNEKFPTRDACISKNEVDRREDIKATDCELGVSQTGLTSCLDAIRDEDCGNPLDTVARLRACRSASICLK